MTKLSPQQLKERHQEKMVKDLVKNSNEYFEKYPELKRVMQEGVPKQDVEVVDMKRYEADEEKRRHLTTIVGSPLILNRWSPRAMSGVRNYIFSFLNFYLVGSKSDASSITRTETPRLCPRINTITILLKK